MNEGHVCCRNIAIIKVKELVSETSKYGVTFKLRLGGVETFSVVVALAEWRIPDDRGEGYVGRANTGKRKYTVRDHENGPFLEQGARLRRGPVNNRHRDGTLQNNKVPKLLSVCQSLGQPEAFF